MKSLWPDFEHLIWTSSKNPDRTPVTDADRAVERALRELLATHRPEDAIIGEEFENQGQSTRSWIIDPIDGTANYLEGGFRSGRV